MGETLVVPKRDRFVVTVGGSNARIRGFDSAAIQMAVDLVKERGGGIVQVTEGIFEIAAPVRLYDNIALSGMGEGTILRKIDGFKTSFVIDADYGELKAVVKDASGFRPGMGIQLYDSENRSGWAVTTAVLTAVEGNILYFDNYLLRDYHSDRNGVIENTCSVIEGVGVRNVAISNLVIDGNGKNNGFLNGCRGGAVYLHKAHDCTIRDIVVRDFNGDGISWQITDNIAVQGCEVTGSSNYGLHPGTGSSGSVVEECHVHHNGSDGIFVCWRVKQGRFKNNSIHHNGRCGINIGHKDTDNCFEANHIFSNEYCGIHMRNETESNGAHRNTWKRNIIEDNGNNKEGYGILIDSLVQGNRIEENTIRDTGTGVQRIGIRITHPIPDLVLADNEVGGHSEGALVR